MAGNANVQRTDVVWINYDLTKQDKERLKKMFAEPNALNDCLEALLNTTYKVTLQFDEFSKAFAAYIWPGSNNGENKGMCLSARGRTPVAALKGVLFRHFDVFQGSWRVPTSKVKLDDED